MKTGYAKRLIIALTIFALACIVYMSLVPSPQTPKLMVSLDVEPDKLKINENATFKATITNTGKENITLWSGKPLFGFEIYDGAGNLKEVFPASVLDILITTPLKPGESYHESVSYSFNERGVYTVTAYAEFWLQDPIPLGGTGAERLYTNSVTILVD